MPRREAARTECLALVSPTRALARKVKLSKADVCSPVESSPQWVKANWESLLCVRVQVDVKEDFVLVIDADMIMREPFIPEVRYASAAMQGWEH